MILLNITILISLILITQIIALFSSKYDINKLNNTLKTLLWCSAALPVKLMVHDGSLYRRCLM